MIIGVDHDARLSEETTKSWNKDTSKDNEQNNPKDNHPKRKEQDYILYNPSNDNFLANQFHSNRTNLRCLGIPNYVPVDLAKCLGIRFVKKDLNQFKNLKNMNLRIILNKKT